MDHPSRQAGQQKWGSGARVEFVVGSHLSPSAFSPGFTFLLPPQKTTSSSSNSTRIDDPHENQPIKKISLIYHSAKELAQTNFFYGLVAFVCWMGSDWIVSCHVM